MACYDCDLCNKHDDECPYRYAYPDCHINTIISAKTIVDDEFKDFYSKIKEKSKDVYDHHIIYLVKYMESLIHDSERPLPEWTNEIEED